MFLTCGAAKNWSDVHKARFVVVECNVSDSFKGSAQRERGCSALFRQSLGLARQHHMCSDDIVKGLLA
jgi:hypothetical protein